MGKDLSKSGFSKCGRQALYKEALHAWFKMKTPVTGSSLSIVTFDQLVKSIALYGAAVCWSDLLNCENITRLMERIK